jgi:hypothetical protein
MFQADRAIAGRVTYTSLHMAAGGLRRALSLDHPEYVFTARIREREWREAVGLPPTASLDVEREADS